MSEDTCSERPCKPRSYEPSKSNLTFSTIPNWITKETDKVKKQTPMDKASALMPELLTEAGSASSFAVSLKNCEPAGTIPNMMKKHAENLYELYEKLQALVRKKEMDPDAYGSVFEDAETAQDPRVRMLGRTCTCGLPNLTEPPVCQRGARRTRLIRAVVRGGGLGEIFDYLMFTGRLPPPRTPLKRGLTPPRPPQLRRGSAWVPLRETKK